MTFATVTVNVDVSLDDIVTQDLIDELEKRGESPASSDLQEKLTEMFYAFKLGKSEWAIELAREIAQLHTGRIL